MIVTSEMFCLVLLVVASSNTPYTPIETATEHCPSYTVPQDAIAEDYDNVVQRKIFNHLNDGESNPEKRDQHFAAAFKVADEHLHQQADQPGSSFLSIYARRYASSILLAERNASGIKYVLEGIEKCNAALKRWPTNENLLREEGFLHSNLCASHFVAGELEKATAAARSWLERARKSVLNDKPTDFMLGRLVNAQIDLAKILHAQKRKEEARVSLQQAISDVETMRQENQKMDLTSLSNVLDKLASTCADFDLFDEACKCYLAIEQNYQQLDKNEPSESRRGFRMLNYRSLASSLLKTQRSAEAIKYFELELKLMNADKDSPVNRLLGDSFESRCNEIERLLRDQGLSKDADRIATLRASK